MVSTTGRTKSTATKSTSTTTASHRDQKTAKNDDGTTIGYRRPNRDKLNNILLLRMTERTLNRKRTKYECLRLIFYDKDRGAFLDRTLKQWARVIVLYIVFYATLSGFTVIMYILFYALVIGNDQFPIRMSPDSPIGQSPAIIILAPKKMFPLSDIDSVIKFGWKNGNRYRLAMRQMLLKYRDQKVDKETVFDCESKTGYMNKSLDEYTRSCYFSVTSGDIQDGFGACSCDHSCHDSSFGYDIGEPCVAIGLAKTTFDEEHFESINVYPKNGIKFCYFPFYNSINYQQPFVNIKLIGAKTGVFVEVYCHAIADNIAEEERHGPGINIGFLISR